MIVGKCVCVLERERLNAHARARKSKEGWAVTAAAEGTAAMHRFVLLKRHSCVIVSQ